MSEAAARMVRLERRVMWRQRLLSLQDALALAAAISGLVAAGVVVIARLGSVAIPVWVLISGTVILSFGTFLIRWFSTLSNENDAAFLIDDSLKLDDRITTSCLILDRGGPVNSLEEALIEDAAERVQNQRAASIVPFRMRRFYSLLPLSAVGLVAALLIPPRSLLVDQTLAAERADITQAGEQLEQTATEIEQSAPPASETMTLAKEQAEIGRSFRRAGVSRADALRRLSALEERIRIRHNDLSNTRADEIVSLADRRMRGVLSTARRAKSEADDASLAPPAHEESGASQNGGAKETRVTAPNGNFKAPESPPESASQSARGGSRAQTTAKAERTSTDTAKVSDTSQAEPRKRLHEPVSAHGNRNAQSTKETAGDRGTSSDTKGTERKLSETSPGDQKTGGETTGQDVGDRKVDEQQKGELPSGSPEALKAVQDSLAERAAKAVPKLSEELIRRAAELRANELKPADIEKLRKAAEILARDLEQIGRSKELQKALQEMARQIKPEQIEQVARELGNHEQLKQEIEAAARLLSENQQAKEIVAGLAGRFARMQDQRKTGDNNQRAEAEPGISGEAAQAVDGSRSNRGVGSTPEKPETRDWRLAGRGRESSLKGKLDQRSDGEFLYLRTKAGVGAARTPYSSAYPQYRREAERSVQRSQVPPNLRSVVRRYFDAINPDAKR